MPLACGGSHGQHSADCRFRQLDRIPALPEDDMILPDIEQIA